jgi:hypothetical protein
MSLGDRDASRAKPEFAASFIWFRAILAAETASSVQSVKPKFRHFVAD